MSRFTKGFTVIAAAVLMTVVGCGQQDNENVRPQNAEELGTVAAQILVATNDEEGRLLEQNGFNSEEDFREAVVLVTADAESSAQFSNGFRQEIK